MIKPKNSKFNKGFTLIETLVAVAILMIAITGPLMIAQKGLSAAIYAKDQVSASFLSQDMMEYLKNKRDSMGFSGWLAKYSVCSPNNPCKLDTTSSNDPVTCSSDATCKLYDDDSKFTIDSNSGSNFPTIFSRKFYVDTTNISNSGDEARVVVQVTWQYSNIVNSVNLENQFFANVTR